MENWQRIVLVIFILVIVIALDLFLYFKTEKIMEDTKNNLLAIEKRIDEKEIEKSKNEAENLTKKWKKYEDKLAYFIEHDEIEKVSLKIAIIEENTQNEELESALEDIAETKYLLKHIEDKYNLTLKNIF